MADLYNKLGACVPIDKTAARQLSKGEHYEHRVNLAINHWTAPPKMKEPVESQKDIRGLRFGRMTVVGLLDGKQARWVVRCACGDYETRRTKSITNPRNQNDSCHICRAKEERRRSAYFHATGRQHPDRVRDEKGRGDD